MEPFQLVWIIWDFQKAVAHRLIMKSAMEFQIKMLILKEGDIVNVDCTTIVHRHYADASRMFCIGKVDEEAKRLVDVTKECLQIGIEAVRPWGIVGDIGCHTRTCA